MKFYKCKVSEICIFAKKLSVHGTNKKKRQREKFTKLVLVNLYKYLALQINLVKLY